MSSSSSDSKAKYALRLLQGYLWYPKSETLDFADYLPKQIQQDIHVLWDEIRPPFAFFEDGTLAASQHIFQFTVLLVLETSLEESGYRPQGMVAWLAEFLQEKLNETPSWVGWQILEDLRELGGR
ncbi:MAG: DUF3208 family protein [Deinococcales bacterium]